MISISSKAVGFAEGSFLEMANTARQAGLSEPEVREIVQLNLAALRFLTTGRWEQYARAREHALETTAREVAAGFPAAADEPIWTFLRSVVTYDPLVHWMQLSQPVFIVYGEGNETRQRSGAGECAPPRTRLSRREQDELPDSRGARVWAWNSRLSDAPARATLQENPC